LLAGFSPIALGVLNRRGSRRSSPSSSSSGDAFRLSRWRTPETREQMYVETVLAPRRSRQGSEAVRPRPALPRPLQGDLRQAVRGRSPRSRSTAPIWALILGTIGTIAFYGMYLWITIATIDNQLTAGEFIMYAGVFRSAQSAMAKRARDIGGMYEDNLYLSNLYEFLDTPTMAPGGTATSGTKARRRRTVRRRVVPLPRLTHPALSGIDLHIPPGASWRSSARTQRQDHS